MTVEVITIGVHVNGPRGKKVENERRRIGIVEVVR